MKQFTYIFLILLISLTFSCSTDDGDDVDVNDLVKDGTFHISELAGTWDATKAQFSVSGVSIGVIEDGGTASMVVQADGRFTISLDPIDRNAYTVSGEMFWEPFHNSFYFAIVWDDEPNDWDTYGDTYDGTTLSLNGGTDTGEYDFDNDGGMESCSVHFIVVRS